MSVVDPFKPHRYVICNDVDCDHGTYEHCKYCGRAEWMH